MGLKERFAKREAKELHKTPAFAPLHKGAARIGGKAVQKVGQAAVQADLAVMDIRDGIDENERKHAPSHIPHANRVIAVLIIISLATSIFQIVGEAVFSSQSLHSLFSGSGSAPAIVSIVYFVLTAAGIASLVTLILLDRKGRIYAARLVTRALTVILIASLLICVVLHGIFWLEATYLFQFVCTIAYQVYNDPNLDRSLEFHNPFSKEERAKAREAASDEYIPLNFFNIFWIFVVASVAGLAMEMVFCALVNHVWEDRAGLVWGPFSPIYGVGAVLMTIALNRFWKKNGVFIFLVAGFIGAAFEFFVSWYMQTAFGVVAWDYQGTFLSIQGRTDFAHFLAWGMVGLVWLRMLLPMVLRVVDMIALRWRAFVTVLVFAFMLVNATTTVLALDFWSQRQAGYPVQTELQQFFDQRYDDQFMQKRFATMGMSQESALRAQEQSKLP